MSLISIRSALQTKLATITPAISTAYERQRFTPVTGVPYQHVNLLPGEAENPAVGSAMYRQPGIFQIMLMYPQGYGSKDIETRAELIRTTFVRGLTLVSGGINVVVNRTPTVRRLPDEKDRTVLAVVVQFYAEIFN